MKVVYIAGCIHSGSTLLNRVLGAHSRVMSVGSLKKLPRMLAGSAGCPCGASSLQDCAFWSRVDAELRAEGRSLDDIDIRTARRDQFEEDNLALLGAVARASGAEVIVDSSRKASRLRWLRRIPGLEVIPVHLYKRPRNQASSLKRKGQSAPRAMLEYWGRNLSLLLATGGDSATVHLSYEHFCLHPEQELRRLLAAFGLEYEPSILEKWGAHELHTLGGNRMKKDRSSRIVLDESWRERLSGPEERLTELCCAPLWQRLESFRVAETAVPESRAPDR